MKKPHLVLIRPLNLQLCMWLYRRLVLGQGVTSATRSVRLDARQFTQCLMMLSTDERYLDWLVGRGHGSEGRRRNRRSGSPANNWNRRSGSPANNWPPFPTPTKLLRGIGGRCQAASAPKTHDAAR